MELIVAIAVIGVMFIGLYRVLRTSSNLSIANSQRSNAITEVNTVISFLRRDVAMAKNKLTGHRVINNVTYPQFSCVTVDDNKISWYIYREPKAKSKKKARLIPDQVTLYKVEYVYDEDKAVLLRNLYMVKSKVEEDNSDPDVMQTKEKIKDGKKINTFKFKGITSPEFEIDTDPITHALKGMKVKFSFIYDDPKTKDAKLYTISTYFPCENGVSIAIDPKWNRNAMYTGKFFNLKKGKYNGIDFGDFEQIKKWLEALKGDLGNTLDQFKKDLWDYLQSYGAKLVYKKTEEIRKIVNIKLDNFKKGAEKILKNHKFLIKNPKIAAIIAFTKENLTNADAVRNLIKKIQIKDLNLDDVTEFTKYIPKDVRIKLGLQKIANQISTSVRLRIGSIPDYDTKLKEALSKLDQFSQTADIKFLKDAFDLAKSTSYDDIFKDSLDKAFDKYKDKFSEIFKNPDDIKKAVEKLWGMTESQIAGVIKDWIMKNIITKYKVKEWIDKKVDEGLKKLYDSLGLENIKKQIADTVGKTLPLAQERARKEVKKLLDKIEKKIKKSINSYIKNLADKIIQSAVNEVAKFSAKQVSQALDKAKSKIKKAKMKVSEISKRISSLPDGIAGAIKYMSEIIMRGKKFDETVKDFVQDAKHKDWLKELYKMYNLPIPKDS